MRFLKAADTPGLRKRAPFTWESADEDPAFVFEIRDGHARFACFFLKADAGSVAPKIALDRGGGFDELSAIVFRAFPFGFYHVALATMGPVRRLRLRPCQGPARFRFLAFETGRPMLVAVLHFLFNLRYQKIGLTVAPSKGGWFVAIGSNFRRIAKFFRDVSAGGGIRVQQAEDDVLARLRLTQILQARPVQMEIKAALAGRQSPLISFVSPVYDPDPVYLRDLVGSFAAEEEAYAELILSDDGSRDASTYAALEHAAEVPGVRVLRAGANAGIAAATNAGIAAALGDWVAFIDHDDAFVPGAVAMIASAILAHPDAVFFYTDEIVANAAMTPVGSFCKPAFDSVLLSGLNYINHFSVFRRDRLAALGGLRRDREGSQDYDLLLRYLAGARPGTVVHIPFLAYTWRRGEGSYSAVFRERSIGNARSALCAAYAVAGRPVTVEPAIDPDLHRVRFTDAPRPLVSAIIPNRDSLALIERVVTDLRQRTDYPVLEIVVVDNGTRDRDVLRFYEARRDDAFTADIVEEPFNFARMCNRGARLARGAALLFLNNDIEVREPDWLAEMVECLAFAETGIVGARLLYPDGTLQHAGVIVGLGGAAGHWYCGDPADEPGPMGRLAVRQTLTAVTGACMLVTRGCFDALGGFDEETFPISYNDVDFCIRARQAGFRTVWTPFATLTHHESASRGSDETGANNIRFRAEFARLQARHGTQTFVDEAFSPFYDRRYARPHLVLPNELPETRANTLG